jgi:hypothetical protein
MVVKMNRAFVALVTMAAWFAISNHCLLGAIEAPVGKPVTHCHGPQPSPVKHHGSDQESPCCKTLRATLVSPVKAPAVQANEILPVAHDFISQVLAFDDLRLKRVSYFADIGPPRSFTFAELVLQRSILAHAPPSRA